MAEEKKSLFPLLILPVIWGTYYVASQKLVGFTSSFTSGLSIRFVVMLALIVIMAKRGELGLLWKTEGVRARLVMIGTLGFLLDWTAFLGLSMSSAATGTALLKCDVLMVNIISVIVYKQKFTWKAWVCTFVMLFGVFMVYPVIKSLALSFYDFEGGEYLFCGINNYVTMCKDPVFWKSLGNTFIYLAIQVPVMVILSLILGVLVEESFLRFRTCYRVSVFLPSVTALVAYAMIFKLLFNTDFGLVNHILRTFGLGGVDWLNTVWGARAVVIMGITWRWTGYNTIIMIAGLKGIPMELYESADIDGASFLQRFFRITIPMVKSIILFVSITSTIGTLQLFDESFVLTKGGPDNATITIGHYLYNTGFSYYKFGYAAALSYALVLIIGILSFVQFKATNGGDN